jgi:hypothetical protein
MQWCNGREFGLKSEGLGFAPSLCSIIFPLDRWKILVALKTQQKIQTQIAKDFWLHVRIESAAPGLGIENLHHGL